MAVSQRRIFPFHRIGFPYHHYFIPLHPFWLSFTPPPPSPHLENTKDIRINQYGYTVNTLATSRVI